MACPAARSPPSQLRRVRLSYRGVDGRAHTGTLVSRRRAAPAVDGRLPALYAARSPIRRMQPIDAYSGSDPRSMAADNTSGFNCRYAAAAGPKRWSVHAYGQAIDVNPVENPYSRAGGCVLRRAGASSTGAEFAAAKAVAGGTLVRAFAAAGWQGAAAGAPRRTGRAHLRHRRLGSGVILENGVVRTMDPSLPTARALAIAGDRWSRAASATHETALPRPERVDLGGRCVLPGFTDSHVHFPTWALAQREVRLEGAAITRGGARARRRRATGPADAGSAAPAGATPTGSASRRRRRSTRSRATRRPR